MNSFTTPSRGSRIAAIDLLRGLIMVIMALDHTRDFFYHAGWNGDPTDLAHTTFALFMTRWITHFCAPVFVFLAGSGTYFQKARGKSIPELSKFLLSRGAWLLVAEISVVGFAWTFDIGFHSFFLQVIWAIGVSMICLAALIHLPLKWIAIIGGAIVLGHNALDGVAFASGSTEEFLWDALHVQHFFHFGGHNLVFYYPVLPWIGVMALGYVFGKIYDRDISDEKRKSLLVWIGLGCIALFCLLRSVNIYGDAKLWGLQPTEFFNVLSFINTTKYPPSLLYLLMTLGPSMLLLRVFDSGVPNIFKPFITYGRVPMFYYLAHLYALHTISIITMLISGVAWSTIAAGIGTGQFLPKAFGFDLPAVYCFWIGTVAMLYPLCSWYDRYKSLHREKWWLSYL